MPAILRILCLRTTANLLSERVVRAVARISIMCQGLRRVTQISQPTTRQSDGVSPPASRWAVTLRALRHRNFQLFFGGQLVSLTGTWMQSVAQAWLVYSITRSSFLLGAVGFASQIPVFLLAPLGGTFADRTNRHRLVVATQAASMILAAILAWLTLSHRVQVWHIFVLAALLGVVNAFDIP